MWYTMQAVRKTAPETDKSLEKVEKLLKNLLTNGKGCGIISNTSALWKAVQKFLKKVEKTFKKPLDKRMEMWYNTKAVRTRVNAAKN